MKHRFFISLVAATVLANHAVAGTMESVQPSKDWSWVSTIIAGSIWAKAGKTQTFYLSPGIEKSYRANKSSNVFASGELFIGMQKTLSPQWLGQLGLALAATGNARLQGVIWDDADPEFDNHRYNYKVRHTRIAVKGKLLFDSETFMLTPWVSGSVGVGFNRARSFSNWPVIFEALPTPNFSDNTKTNFTYTLGAGVQKSLNAHWQLGIGYEFADWGKSKLGRSEGQTLNTGLTLNHLHTNGVLLNLTYIA